MAGNSDRMIDKWEAVSRKPNLIISACQDIRITDHHQPGTFLVGCIRSGHETDRLYVQASWDSHPGSCFAHCGYKFAFSRCLSKFAVKTDMQMLVGHCRCEDHLHHSRADHITAHSAHETRLYFSYTVRPAEPFRVPMTPRRRK